MSRRDPNESGRWPIELLLIHRPSYDDWTFPKGKTDPGESLQQAAVREIAEETGIPVRLGHPLTRVDYETDGGIKHVSYWMARQLKGTDSTFSPNKEVDDVRWVRPRDAAELLTYAHDRILLDEFRGLRDRNAHRTRTLVAMRHGKAVSPGDFSGHDRDRTLTRSGEIRAQEMVPLLAAYGVRRVISSPAVRCVNTVEPFADSIDTFVQIDERVGEQATAADVTRSLHALMDRKKPTVVCSHGPTVARIFAEIDAPALSLAPGAGVVVHHRKGRVIATESLPHPSQRHM